jgi:hypothetical protein
MAEPLELNHVCIKVKKLTADVLALVVGAQGQQLAGAALNLQSGMGRRGAAVRSAPSIPARQRDAVRSKRLLASRV